ncbi:MAG: glycoside hydrolase family 1 protein [Deltaproteobacteria bacterium]|nr:glycoside hydrolase family 1 protein [Deltaproteobacteria bacterium]
MIPLLLLACSSPAPRDFPEDFVWGAAVAGFQVDMGCPTLAPEDCEDRASDWYQWVTEPSLQGEASLHLSGDPVSDGPGMWELFEEDAARLGADGLGSLRLSVEWSRLFPDGAAERAATVEELDAFVDRAAAQRYHQMFAALSAAGVAPMVTLNHYTLPLWVHDGLACHRDLGCEASGWLDGPRIERLMALYAGWVAREYGGEVDRWATLNEPLVIPLAGYLQPGEMRSNPPGVSMEVEAAIASICHQVEASARMYDAVHAEDRWDADGDGQNAAVGVVMNMIALAPQEEDDPADALGVAHCDFVYHRVFLDGLTAGAWDDDLDGTFDRERADLAGRLDWIGINYYNRVTVAGLPIALIPELPVMDFYPEFSWEPYPEGLGEVVERTASYGLPLWITENGTPLVEEQGSELLLAHLRALAEADAQVEGYHWWSYVDNYEWNHGMGMRFGLYALDPVTKARVERPVMTTYRDIAATGALPE